jgi:hypothetical protein
LDLKREEDIMLPERSTGYHPTNPSQEEMAKLDEDILLHEDNENNSIIGASVVSHFLSKNEHVDDYEKVETRYKFD